MYGNLIPIFNVSFSRKTQIIKHSHLKIDRNKMTHLNENPLLSE